MDKSAIAKLTKAAEDGNGCSIKEAIHDFSFDDSLKTLQAIQEQNKLDQAADPNIPNVYLVMDGNQFRATATLTRKTPGWSHPDEIATDSISFKPETIAAHTQTCTDVK